MPLVAAKCTSCGGDLLVDPGQEAAVCKFCGTAFITEKAINNYNTTNITNISKLDAEVVNVMSSESQENLHKTGQTFVQMKSYAEAEETFAKMQKKYPYDPRGWYGTLQVLSQDFTILYSTAEFYEKVLAAYDKYLVSVRQSGQDHAEQIKLIDHYVSQVDAAVEKKIQAEKEKIEELKKTYDEEEIRLNKPSEQIQQKKKQKKTFAIRFCVTVGVIVLIMWISGMMAGAANFFGNRFEYEGAYWDFWRMFYGMEKPGDGFYVGLLGGLVGLPAIAGLCAWIVAIKWKKLDREIKALENDEKPLIKLKQDQFSISVDCWETEKKLPQLREKRKKLTR